MAGHGDGGRSESHPDRDSRSPNRDSHSSSRAGDYERPELKPKNPGGQGRQNLSEIGENPSPDNNEMDPPTEGFKNVGRGSQTVESVSLAKAQKMVKEWEENDLPYSHLVTAGMLLENFPQIRRETKLGRDIDRMTTISILLSKVFQESNVPPELREMILSDMEKDPDRMALKSALSSQVSEMSNLPPELREMMTGKWEGKTREMEKEREFLKTTFPKDPTQVVSEDIARRSINPIGDSFIRMANEVFRKLF